MIWCRCGFTESLRLDEGLFSPKSQVKQSQLQQVAQDCVQPSFKHPKGQRPQNLSEYPVPVFDQLYRGKKNIYIYAETEFPVLQFVFIGSCPEVGRTG